ncbi:unnamed protein product [Cylicocyclus nassatus]|uniref:Uncharacterized protein n=1 Tax=Cylicocyclus nassatus TaxID=53992 RepID=A0AA36MA09_CYLNA|nr:unnamed protein product [Cylicocyclus nassatus]
MQGYGRYTSVLVVAVPPFTVEIAKGDERLCFHLDLVESVEVQREYGFRVEEFYVAPAAKERDEDVPAEVYASSGIYIDPDFHDLLFVRYLEERGPELNSAKLWLLTLRTTNTRNMWVFSTWHNEMRTEQIKISFTIM